MNWDKAWQYTSVTLVALASLVSGADLFNFMLGMVGIVFVLGVAYKKPWSQLAGSGFCVMLAYASYQAGFIANAAVNGLVLAPLAIYGYFLWRKRESKGQVERKMDNMWFVIMIGVMSIITLALYPTILAQGGNLPFLDTLTAVLPVASTLLMCFAYREQWILWIPYNLIQAGMWLVASIANPMVSSIFVLKFIFLVNSIIGFINWSKIRKII